MTAKAAPVHFLLVGGGADVAALRGIVARLPVNAYGQVLIEVASELHVEDWPAPPGVTVSWLCRDRSFASMGRAAQQGELVARAVTAWVAEWMPEEEEEHAAPYVLWLGCAANAHVERLYLELAERIGHVHFHDPRAHS